MEYKCKEFSPIFTFKALDDIKTSIVHEAYRIRADAKRSVICSMRYKGDKKYRNVEAGVSIIAADVEVLALADVKEEKSGMSGVWKCLNEKDQQVRSVLIVAADEEWCGQDGEEQGKKKNNEERIVRNVKRCGTSSTLVISFASDYASSTFIKRIMNTYSSDQFHKELVDMFVSPLTSHRMQVFVPYHPISTSGVCTWLFNHTSTLLLALAPAVVELRHKFF